ncbi:hypothetical protein OG455_05815 [Kitasatospora sp. NBC_01287]|uniref:hypothetical protein n=1 Tax=Kitasatospora sp. NBC_01287 TaxID=2903573 RepID=UPI0022521D34|nr:hypothetical protein [Kitasatospora sp. NBC_01287]MCX4745045.1 hypothetical protein [Kitasatospora sp. NBC_01287]
MAGILDACARPLVYSRHHWLLYKGEYRVRADLRSALESIRSRGPAAWDDEESDLVLTLFALNASAVGLDELVEHASSAALRTVLQERYALYEGVLGPAGRSPEGLLDLAHQVARMRGLVQGTHELYSVIDGRAWYRTEGVIPRAELDPGRLADAVEQELAALFDGPAAAGAEQRLSSVTRQAIAEEGDSASVVRAIMRAALVDPALRADHVTVTCPMGDLLDRPSEMTTSQAFFTETQLRDGLELGDYAERLGHESAEQLGRTIKARMLKLKRGAIRSLYGPGCMQGQFVEKHGGHMIFRNEDAHYRGHQAIGCSSGGRGSFGLRYRIDGTDQELTPMVGDFRVVRMSHDEADTFDADGLRETIRYAEWIRIVVEETYRAGAVIRVDQPVAGVDQPAAVDQPVIAGHP